MLALLLPRFSSLVLALCIAVLRASPRARALRRVNRGAGTMPIAVGRMFPVA
ncbi:hypothetical protein [Rhodovulum sp. MB263]|uniref:hypothetical protein n=1 Tax=unclassified Rhodovulum TaxID=2631432 RepID=UPI0012DB5F9C|nr:hypothetical protein [Rhodovulum sp. MB263]